MTTFEPLVFSKFHGLGNDFVIIDCSAGAGAEAQRWLPDSDCKAICDRNFGVGADGVIMYAAVDKNACSFEMRIVNGDGSVAQMCGNGIRCLAQHLANTGAPRSLRILTGAGVISTEVISPGSVAVNMGEPRLMATDVPMLLTAGSTSGMALDCPIVALGEFLSISAISMGNPHGVIFVDDLDNLLSTGSLDRLGPALSAHAMFPDGANIEFVEVLNPKCVKMVVWERGSGRTLACGTGACAVVVAGVLTDRLERKCDVLLEGGTLDIEWKGASTEQGSASCVFKTGPAHEVFRGNLCSDWFRQRAAW
ncbi:unnamed protein product [Ectocarpus fasciculatus]